MRKKFTTAEDNVSGVQDQDAITNPPQKPPGVSSRGKRRSPVRRSINDLPFCWQCKAALRMIRAACGNVGDGASVLLVYFALTEIASDHQSERFTTTQGYIAERAFLSIRTVRDKMKVLEDLGLVNVEIPNLRSPGVYILLSVTKKSAVLNGNGCRTSGNGRKESGLPPQEECTEESFEEAAGWASSSGAKRPPCEAQTSSKRNSRAAAEPAAPVAPVEDVPSEQAGAAAPETPVRNAGAPSNQNQGNQEDHSSNGMNEEDDSEVEKAKKRADKLLRYASQAHANLLIQGIVQVPLRDRLERARAAITIFLQKYPEYKVSRILQTLVRVWNTELSPQHQWYASKLNDCPSLLPKILNGKDFSVLEGASIELCVSLGKKADDATWEDFEGAGILDSWVAEHTCNPEAADRNNGHKNETDAPEVEQPINAEPTGTDSASGPVEIAPKTSDVVEAQKSPPCAPVGRAAAHRPSASSRKFFG